MRILVDDVADRDALASALEGAGCVPLRIGRSLELPEEGDPTRLELGFFLRAWRLDRPEAQLELV